MVRSDGAFDDCTVNLHVLAMDRSADGREQVVTVLRSALADIGLIDTPAPGASEAGPAFAVDEGSHDVWLTVQAAGFTGASGILVGLAAVLSTHPRVCCIVSYVVRDTPIMLRLYQNGRLADWFYDDPEAPEMDAEQGEHNYSAWGEVLPNGTSLEELRRRWQRYALGESRILAILDLMGLKVWSELDPSDPSESKSIVWFGKVASQNAAGAEPPISRDRPQGAVVPKAFCGLPTDAKRRSKTIARRVVEAGGWDDVEAGLDFVRVDDAPGQIVLDNSFGWARAAGIYPCYLAGEVDAACARAETARTPEAQERVYALRRRLLLQGLDRFWYALCVLNSESFNMLGLKGDAEEAMFAREAVGKLMHWWPLLENLDAKFARSGPDNAPWVKSWGRMIRRLLYQTGLPSGDVERIAALDSEAAKLAIGAALE